MLTPLEYMMNGHETSETNAGAGTQGDGKAQGTILPPANSGKELSELVLYKSADGTVRLDVQLEKETIWLTQKQMGLLFGKDSDTIGLHIRNIYKEGELEESATPEDSSVVQQEGRRKVARKMRFYTLDAVISVG